MKNTYSNFQGYYTAETLELFNNVKNIVEALDAPTANELEALDKTISELNAKIHVDVSALYANDANELSLADFINKTKVINARAKVTLRPKNDGTYTLTDIKGWLPFAAWAIDVKDTKGTPFTELFNQTEQLLARYMVEYTRGVSSCEVTQAAAETIGNGIAPSKRALNRALSILLAALEAREYEEGKVYFSSSLINNLVLDCTQCGQFAWSRKMKGESKLSAVIWKTLVSRIVEQEYTFSVIK